MDNKKADIRVIKQVIAIGFECPHCEEDVEIKYSDFCDEAGEVCDWGYTMFRCPICNNLVEIDDVDWDN